MSYLADHTFLLYVGAVVIAVALALLSSRRELVITGLLLAADCALWNLTLAVLGFARAPIYLPLFDTMFCGFLAFVWLDTRSPVVRAVATLFLPAVAAWAWFLLRHEEATYACYLTANLIFLAQVAILGVSGGVYAYLDHRAAGDALWARLLRGAHRVHASGRSLPEEPPQ